MKSTTEFGELIIAQLNKNKLHQKDLAEVCGISEGMLSKYIHGNNIPTMDFIAKCVKTFGLEKEELVYFINSAFSTTILTHNMIILDTRYTDPELNYTLAQFATAIMLYPRPSIKYCDDENFPDLSKAISKFLVPTFTKGKLHPPPYDEEIGK